MTETLTTEQVEDAPEFVAHFKSGRPLPHPLFDYWTSLDGKTGELGYQWSDKPHRHVFDLLNEVVHLRTELLALRKRVGELEGAGWQMLDLLKRVVTVLDAEVFDELAADTLLRDAVTFLYTAKEPNGWQDIATAPRDGTHVHVAFAGTSSPQTVAHWFGPPDLPGLRAGNWYLSVQQLEGPPVHPTHWRTHDPPPHPQGAIMSDAHHAVLRLI